MAWKENQRSYFKIFVCKCFILNNKDNLHTFNPEQGIPFGYSITSRTYRVYNKTSLVVKESMHVILDEPIVLLEKCEDYVSDFIEREAPPNEEIE